MLEGEKAIKLKWKDKIFLALLAFSLLWIGYNELFGKNKKTDLKEAPAKKEEVRVEKIRLKLGETFLEVEIADDSEKRILGLGKRATLQEGQGMLFLHEKPAKYLYSMRDMQFGLDFIFINQGRVVGLQEDVSQDFSGEIKGDQEYDSVLEVPFGWAKKNGIKIGDEVSAQK